MALDWNFPGGGFGSVIRLVIFFSFSFLFFVLIVFFFFFLLSLFDSIRPAVYILALKQLMLYFSSHPFHKFSLSLSLVLWACYLFILFYSVFIFCVSLFSFFFWCSSLLWFTSAGNPTRTARWTVQCPPVSWAMRPRPIRNEPMRGSAQRRRIVTTLCLRRGEIRKNPFGK